MALADEGFSTISGGNMKRIGTRLLVSTSVLVLAAAAARAQPQYEVTEIPPLGALRRQSHLMLNQRGDVAGVSWLGGSHPFLYTAADGVRDLGLIPDSRFGEVWGFNDHGDVLIGYYMNDTSTRYVVNSGGTVRELVWPTETYTVADSIDNAGRVVGWYSAPARGAQPFVLSGDAFTQLPVPAGLQGWAFDSNTAGQVAGARWRVLSIRDTGESVARIWQPDGSVTEIAPPAGWGNTAAYTINERGDVLGASFNGTINQPTSQKPFLYRDGVFTELPTPPGWTSLSANAMNNAGDVAGTFTGPDSVRHLFLYSGGEYTDLSQVPIPPGYGSLFVEGFNDSGQILVSTFFSGGDLYSYLLTPVPEPAAAADVLLVLAASLLTRRR